MTGEWSVFILVLKPRPHGPFHGIMFKSNVRKIYAWRIIMGNIFKRKSKLNERQLEILRSKDLPTEWKQLTTIQRQSIVAIEEMLEYVEKKYKKPFCYAGYRRSNPLFMDEESLLCYAQGDDPDIDCFTVKREKIGFRDGYAWVTQTRVVQKEMEDKLSGIFEGQKYKMFVKLTGVSDEGVVEAFSTTIYIDNSDSVVTDSIMEKIVSIISDEPRYCKIYMYSFKKPVVDILHQTVPYMHILGIIVADHIVIACINLAVIDIDILRPDWESVGIMRRIGSSRSRVFDCYVMGCSIAALTVTTNGDIGIGSILYTEIA